MLLATPPVVYPPLHTHDAEGVESPLKYQNIAT